MLGTLQGVFFRFVDSLSRFQKQTVLFAVDTVIAPLALLVTLFVVSGGSPGSDLLPGLWPLFPVVAFLAAIATLALRMTRIQLKSYETSGIMRTAWMAVMVTAALHFVIVAGRVNLGAETVILFGMIFFLGCAITRVLMLQVLLWALRAGEPRRRVLIYGAGNTGVQLVAALRNHASIRPVAFIDDSAALQSLSVAGLRIYSPDKIRMLATSLGVDRVILAMPSLSAPKLAQIARRVQAMDLKVMSVPSFAQLVGLEDLLDTLKPIEPDEFLGRIQIDRAMPQGGETYRGRTVLVSGAGGSIGSELCRQLLRARPACLILFEMSEIALYTIERELRDLAEGSDTRIVAVLGSSTDSRMARMVMAEHRIDVVFHAAAYKHVPLVESNPLAGLANNVLGTRTLGDAANEAGVRKFVLVSSDKAVRPANVMGASKRLAELVIQDLAKRAEKTHFSIVRFGNVLGSSGSVIPLFQEQIARGGPITLTHDDVTRYFMTISEASQLVLLAGSFSDEQSRDSADVFVLDMGKPIRIRDLARQMIERAGCTLRDEDNPEGDIEILVTGLRPGEKLHEELLIGEGLLTTPHPKILRAQEQSLSELQMASALRALRGAVATGDKEAALDLVRTYVEGYGQSARVAAKL
ncbi:polysaccharide biosynthesis protein [Szabonella alba]|uniref:Polysaccharide biosynthesis protein n=1 Tax=Szabonella alba TaxID=2804194 RepID=A0A8K0XZ46_9RHOB|nr:nucleoside-diphosphate sugar epimerase/dehydratase [Szabonella alba]MBL4915693.1 polysaccharide biosynthesis protein [Szabonella alba]